MLSWILKKRAAAAAAPKAAPAERRPAEPQASAPAPSAAGPAVDETALLHAAQGDDEALLRLAQSATALGIKMEAVQGLAGEAALRQAEREFRRHDRKVHRLAKQRLEAAVLQRESRATAYTLLERTRGLLEETPVALNHVVALDREWQALPAHTLLEDQIAEFAALRARLDDQMRAHDEALRLTRAWMAGAQQLLAQVPAADPGAASADAVSGEDIARLGQDIEALRASRPDAPAAASLDAALAQALERLQARAQVLEQARQDEAELALRAQAREAAERERSDAAARAAQPMPASPQEQAQAAARAAEQLQRLEGLVQQGEAALADGHLAELQRHLQAYESTLAKARVTPPDALRARHQALWAERHRLQGWQAWGGQRARDELAAEAEELARQTLLAADPEQPHRPKLNLKAHAEAIQALRARWKQLDQLGGGVSQEQWRRLDAALQTAHEPLAAQHAALRAARQENLLAREALLSALEAVPLPGVGAPEVQDVRNMQDTQDTQDSGPETDSAATSAPDWKGCVRELDRFQTAWRKLGPLEHTAPQASREALQERLRAALARIEAPLQAQRDAAAAEREQFIARALSLVPADGGRVPPDALRRVRELQQQWQAAARRLALPRGLEAALWARFKSATDSVFSQREADSARHDAELAANLAAQEAVIERLAALTADSAPAEIERALADADRSWREGGELPRGALAPLEKRFHAAREAAAALRGAGAQRRWQRQCDALAASLARCEQREDEAARGAPTAADLGVDGAAPARDEAPPQNLSTELPADLPTDWAQALAQRLACPARPGPLPAEEVDELLLQLESALGLPSPPKWQAARQALKLRALKDALEGRRAAPTGAARPAQWLAATVRQGGLGPAQRARLLALVTALRAASPGTLGSPTP